MDHGLQAGRREALTVSSAETFIRENTRLRPVPHVPEISLYVADEAVPLWQKTEEELGEMGLPPPFWAFAWAGGQALARYILDHPQTVRGKSVLDLASGSGLVAIAAMKAGATRAVANDIDPFAIPAIALNATANNVTVATETMDRLDPATASEPFGTVLAGDIFYERDTAARAFVFLQRMKTQGALTLVGDPGRSYLPKEQMTVLAEYEVPVIRDLEDAEIKRTKVWALKD
ncbi:MAG: methyltransferase [Xanthobacteraceae bacterium]|nr:methyltransferase [Xanthobacteraceae bacterium]QYK44949.1 MAG: methyltransferase [Xanthobacteraceae bacterium]